ncbi:GlxA family transcriptional regulator [Tenggerimyces flavus]|uniref:GlxA family transcriptional regulator n=1 Tax=Tenggerimyces flavus TaxID=1708749 RepID=A0ABV7YNS4_9ACTN|nr:helix-turn-helix domain-containing protein [Tenggerimyces flavus]MBM7790122.1 transcriptional regulator GlxA family with amidase domain [Tenggerimyces flavus]
MAFATGQLLRLAFQRVRTGAGHLVAAEPASGAGDADLLVVPALAERRPERLLERISGAGCASARRLIAAAGQREKAIASACTGTFLLAESGVLDCRHATTSWWLAPLFRRRYPSVRVDMSKMVVRSESVTTAGAAFGHVDLALAIVRQTSPAFAELVSRYLVVDHRPSEAAYIISSALAESDPTVSAFETWVRKHLDQPLELTNAVRDIGVSERTLQRVLRRTLGTSPVRFVQAVRVEQAMHLLRTTDQSLYSIAHRVGYESGRTLGQLIRRRTGIPSSALRQPPP